MLVGKGVQVLISFRYIEMGSISTTTNERRGCSEQPFVEKLHEMSTFLDRRKPLMVRDSIRT